MILICARVCVRAHAHACAGTYLRCQVYGESPSRSGISPFPAPHASWVGKNSGPHARVFSVLVNSSEGRGSQGTHLPGPDLNVKVTPLVRYLENLGPGEAVDPQAVPVDEQAIGTDS